jgi:hypothetical protein
MLELLMTVENCNNFYGCTPNCLMFQERGLFSERSLVILVWDSVHAMYHFISLVLEEYLA